MTTNNIELTPVTETDLNPNQSTQERLPIQQFPNLSAWAVLGLVVFTLGIYSIYWVYSRAQVINQYRDNAISDNLIYCFIGSTAIVILTLLLPYNGFFNTIYTVSSLAQMATVLMIALTFRECLQAMIQESNGHKRELSIPLSIIFNAVYFQYIINESLEALTKRSAD